jgi:hypothetical protein
VAKKANAKNIFTEPKSVDPNTLRNLGPLCKMAGVWEGRKGKDVNPKAKGPERNEYIERYSLQPIDPQLNGPQLLYGLRYFTFITEPDKTEMFHEQVGYWLWEPATQTVLHTLAIPRGQIAMAAGAVKPSASQFTLSARRASLTNGIVSGVFLEEHFTTLAWDIEINILSNESWSYAQDTQLLVKGRDTIFHHTDANTLRKIEEPTPNPSAKKGGK